jgi:KDO2-lipid IV(A) lauroyltransferase
LLSAHLTSMEMGGRLLSMFHPFHPLYRKHKNPVFELVMHRSRSNHTDKAIERGDMRGMMRSLKQNVAIWYAPDQNYGSEQSIFVNFFGQPASTITATSRLAGIYGSPVVPFFQQRLPNNQGYKLTIYPALENFPTEDIAADTQRINNIIEAEIRKMPEQYLWSHRRFKTRPEGMESVY